MTPEVRPRHRWFCQVGTTDDLVVRQATTDDVTALETVLREPHLAGRAAAHLGDRLRDEVATGSPVTWVVMSRPRRVVGVARVDLGVSAADAAIETFGSRRWGDDRQRREAVGIVRAEIERHREEEMWFDAQGRRCE